jgi:hypothetical protein
MGEVDFFCRFPDPWTLRVSGMGCYTSKCEKSQNHCTLVDTLAGGQYFGRRQTLLCTLHM